MFGTGDNEAGTFTLNRYIWGAVEADHCIFFTNYSHNIHAITFTKKKKKKMIILVHQEGRRLFTHSSVLASIRSPWPCPSGSSFLRVTEAASRKRCESES